MLSIALLPIAAALLLWAVSILINVQTTPITKFFWEGFYVTVFILALVSGSFILAALALP